MRTKTRRYQFVFSPEIGKIIDDLAEKKDWTLSKVVEKAVKLLNEKENLDK